MSPIFFNGFPSGARVTIGGMTAASWGEVDGGGSVWDKPASPGTSITMTVLRSDYQIAPEGVIFEPILSGFDTNTAASTGDYDPSYHDKVYFWDYGESYNYQAPAQVIAMDAADGGDRKNSRYSIGPMGAHVYRTPGTYTVRLAVLEPASGKWGQYSGTITIEHADTFFWGASTLFVDTTRTFGNAPPGAQRFSSLDAAFATLEAASTPHRIVLERGQTHTITSQLGYRPPSGAINRSFRLEARPGTGPRPVLELGAGYASGYMILDRATFEGAASRTGTVFSGLEFRGLWDARTETGTWGQGAINAGTSGSRTTVIDDCVFDGMHRSLSTTASVPSGQRSGRLFFVNDCDIGHQRGWSDYGIYEGDPASTIILGTRIAQPVEALAGGPKDGTHNNHGSHRTSSPNRTIILASDYFTNTGWSALGGVQAIQPCLRWGSSATFSGGRLLMWGCAMESPNQPINPAAFNEDQQSRAANMMIEGNAIICGFQGQRPINLSHGGLTARNNLIVFPDTDYSPSHLGGHTRTPVAFVGADAGGSRNTDQRNLDAPIRIYNNTLVNLSDTGGVAIWSGESMSFRNVATDNNLIYAPNAAPSETGHEPLVAKLLFSARFEGYKDASTSLDTRTATPASSAAFMVPQIGSSALGAALREPNAGTDFAGNLRPEPPSIGAAEAG